MEIRNLGRSGLRVSEQVTQNVGAATWRLSAEELHEIDRITGRT